jgi:predicted DNA-binding protein (UPF0251 family)
MKRIITNYDPRVYLFVPSKQESEKRKIIDRTLKELHTMQLSMIDEAVEKSDMKEAQAVIAHVMKLK